MTNRTLNLALGLATLVGMVTSLYMIFMYVPPEQEQGIVQLIFYYHVPLAWDAFASFGLVAVAGIFYLWLGGQIWDDLGRAAAEIGFLFCTVFMVVGSLWAKPIWGTWWTWDSRLTTTFVLWMMYLGYLLMRAMVDDSAQIARYSAVVGIVAALDVPVIIVSVRLWRTIHPAVLVTKQGAHGLEDPRMVATLLVALGALTLLFVWFLLLRFAELRMRTRLGNLARAIALAQVRAGDV
ncbi:MAG TPA: cytochrome c biogenesis protein CcsA [Candidatus Binataceae bacterium]|nr:cytochrome c biogenesis protein CcsA [Candidatus Binataceae bacterium]